MKVETVKSALEPGKEDEDLVMFVVSGPVDPSDAVLMRAREMVIGTGSIAMRESFDWAVSSNAVLSGMGNDVG